MEYIGSPQIEIQLIVVLTAMTCAIPGVFLVLRRMALISDAISHTVILGIVIAFWFTEDLDSPLLLLGASLSGVMLVIFIELLKKTQLVKEDAAIGIVFPAMFALAILIITQFFDQVHLDTDIVIVGDITFAPFNRIDLFGFSVPESFVSVGVIWLINLIFILTFYKELKLSSFDPGLALVLGFSPVLLNYVLMSLVSVTIVQAFDVVGSILVVALMIAPPATAFLLTNHLSWMILLSIGIGSISGVSGYWLARELDTSISGSIALMAGFFFLIAFLFAPQRGSVIRWLKKRAQVHLFQEHVLLVHLYNHEGTAIQIQESTASTLHLHLGWNPIHLETILKKILRKRWIQIEHDVVHLTESGRFIAKTFLE